MEVRPISKEKSMKDFDVIPRLMYVNYPKGPFSGPFFEIFLENHPKHQEQDNFELEEIFKIIHSSKYLWMVPKYANSRETWANIFLVTSAIVLYKKGLLNMLEIYDGVKAF